ncbi:hypothetical protein [Sphingobacterium sp. LRF_L2]|uniref:hypothetical protein n=1 Tax=Sphingobacterium sp. LRF_L2 TaxID=3369421 RepID=UPI003F61033B
MMGLKLFFLFSLLVSSLVLRAQDSISRDVLLESPLEEDSKTSDYLKDGYYDTIARYEQIPKVDTALYGKLIKKYATEEFDYAEDSMDKIGFFQKIFKRLSHWIDSFFPNLGYVEFTDVYYKVLGFLGILILVWIVYRIIFSGNRLLFSEKNEQSPENEIRFVEKNLLDLNLLDFVNKAKIDGDFVLAIRYLNLLNIQLLARKNVFDWKYTKTHIELIEEIEDLELKKDFERNVSIFNRVWYGKAVVDQAKYDEYADYFFNFQAKWR